jgi:hypothetical protein
MKDLDKLISRLRWPLAAFGIVYLVCMFVAPWIMGRGQWSYVQDVWDRWQGFNVGILALIASVIAFEITRYKENKQRDRDFLAARAFLPGALSELSSYLKGSAGVHLTAWEEAALSSSSIPADPIHYKGVFENCIRHAEPKVGEFLASMLAKLQVHDARLTGLVAGKRDGRAAIYWYVLSLGELQALVNKLFDFSRGETGFDSSPISWDDFRNAYMNLGIHVSDFELDAGEGKRIDLETSTKRYLARERGEKEPEYPGKS